MKILYRISDGGNAKQKPAFVYNKQHMFLHFTKVFANHDIYVFADNVCESTYQFLISKHDPAKVIRITLGNAKSFMFTLDFAIANFSENEICILQKTITYIHKMHLKLLKKDFILPIIRPVMTIQINM